ncbi:MAG: tetratricopeptide repeat protein [Microscillaceae bacterium]|jgi:CHAT domain-containing protein|nr:tetratricopeptide repeat protein [Microscillaceae bacterium]
MQYIYTLLFLLIWACSQAQQIPMNPNKTDSKGLRQGKWTILYDKDWNVIQESTNAQFYRLITYKNDKPMGKVYDMYANGKIQMETTLLADRPQDVMNGETIFYDEAEKKQKIQIFENGTLIDENIYRADGTLIIEKWQFLDSLGAMYQKQKNFEQAFEMLNRAKLKAAKEFGKKHQNYVKSLKNLGDLYIDVNNYSTAEAHYLEAIDIQKQTIGDKNAEYAGTLRKLANTYNNLAKFTKSEALLLEAIDIYTKTIGKNNTDYAKTLRGLAVVYYRVANYPKSEQYFLEAKTISEKVDGKESLDYSYILASLGNLYRYTGRYDQAEPIMQEALIILKKYNDSFYSSALGNLGLLYQGKGNITRATDTFLEVLAIQKKQLGTNHPNYAQTLRSLAFLYQQGSNYAQAESMYRESLKIQKAIFGEKHPNYLETLDNLGLLYENIGNYAEAEALYKQALQGIRETLGNKHPNYANVLNKLGTLYFQKNDNLTQAEPLLLEAIEIIRTHFGENSTDYANYLSNFGIFYLEIANYQKAEEILLQSLSILQKNLGADHLYCARLMNILGNLYQIIGKPQAETMLKQAVVINQKAYGEKSNEYAYSISNLGVYYQGMKAFAKADSLFNQALAIQKEVLGESNTSYLKTYFNLASVNQELQNYPKAELLALDNLKRWKEVAGTLKVQYEECLNLMGRLYYINFEYSKAVPYYQESSQKLMDIIERNIPIMSQKEKHQFLMSFSERLEKYITFTYEALQKNLNYMDWIYNNALFSKGLLLNNQNKIRNRVLASKDTALQNLYQNWHTKRNILAQIYQMSIEEKISKGINEIQLEEEVNQIEKKLSNASELFAQANEKKRYTWQDVQKKLKKNEAAIEIVRFRPRRQTQFEFSDTAYYAVLMITPQTQNKPEVLVLTNGNELEEKQLKIYQNSIKFKKTDKTSYAKYWQKIAEKLKSSKIKKVYCSPDGVYNQINLNTLQNPQTNKYVSEEFEIQLVSNTKDLITRQKGQKTRAEGGVFIGYPNYNDEPKLDSLKKDDERSLVLSNNIQLDTTQRFFDGTVVTELPNTKIEIENIQAIFQKNQIKSQIFLAQLATEELVKSLKNPQILHIATHGFFLQDADNEENIDEKDSRSIKTNTQLDNALLRSGLLFAGATQVLKRKAEDGILTAYEAMNLDLDDTDLVVMSACETGLGEVSNGEGVYGLQRAFQVAGAKTVLMSLWTVSDEATKDLMTLFYENWITKNQPKRQAFNNAQKELKKKFPEPYYWGAFVMVGE